MHLGGSTGATALLELVIPLFGNVRHLRSPLRGDVPGVLSSGGSDLHCFLGCEGSFGQIYDSGRGL